MTHTSVIRPPTYCAAMTVADAALPPDTVFVNIEREGAQEHARRITITGVDGL